MYKRVVFVIIITFRLLGCYTVEELAEAVKTDNQTKIIAILDIQPTLIDERTTDNLTVLHKAVLLGNKEVFLILIKRGASINAIDGMGSTPLLSALTKGKKELATLLLKEPNINLSIRHTLLFTPLEMVKNKDQSWNQVKTLIKQLETKHESLLLLKRKKFNQLNALCTVFFYFK